MGIWEPTDLTSYQKIFVNFGCMIAKRDIAQKWGSGTMPRLRDWKAGMDKCMVLEKEIYKGRGCPRKFEKIWGGWAANGASGEQMEDLRCDYKRRLNIAARNGKRGGH